MQPSLREPLGEVGNVAEEDYADEKFVTVSNNSLYYTWISTIMYHFASHIQDHSVCLLDIPSSDPEKYALACLTAHFTDQELTGSCYAQTSKSTKPPELAGSCYAQTSKSTKPPLARDKIALLEGMYNTSVHILDDYVI